MAVYSSNNILINVYSDKSIIGDPIFNWNVSDTNKVYALKPTKAFYII
jgi:hypothetical protein